MHRHAALSTFSPFIWKLLWLGTTVFAQLPTLAPVRGLHRAKPQRVVLQGVHVWLGAGKVVRDVAILIEEGKITRIEPVAKLSPPGGAQIIRYPAGTWVYPAFIEPWTSWGLPSFSRKKDDPSPQYESSRHPLLYPNESVRLDFAAETSFIYQPEQAKKLREMGFAAVHIAPKEGIVRGTGVTLLLNDLSRPEERFLRAPSILHAGFEKGHVSQEYPGSKMGAIALVRQLLYDALWYRQASSQTPPNAALERLKNLLRDTLRWCWTAQTPEDAFRVAQLMREWKQAGPLHWALLATGYEYEWLPYLPKEGLYLLPIGLPILPPPHSPDFYARLPLTALRRWEQAPFRIKWLIQAGYTVALTSQGIPDTKTFWEHLRTVARTGISPDTLLLCLTEIPARWLGQPSLGRIAPGAWANLLVFSDTLWETDAKLLETWVAGEREVHVPIPPQSPAGTFDITPFGWKWTIPTGLPPFSSRLIAGADTHTVEIQYEWLSNRFCVALPPKVGVGHLAFSMTNDSSLQGIWVQPTGSRTPWSGRRIAPPDMPTRKEPPKPLREDSLLSRRTFPNSAFGRSTYPSPSPILFRKATVWTGDTILPETDVFITEGKIQRIGRDLPAPPGAQIIEANGGALTAGIIDEHSHIAIEGGVNEASDAVTPEVRIRDVIEPTDINIYRHIAGGVVAVQLLHGSANPIGGQSACIKLKWGLPPDSFLIPDAPPFNKFALGENVKQSNWGEAYTIRYPQTRMGVEQIIEDAFEAARRYKQEWEAYEAARKKSPTLPTPRRNLRYEALAEILAGKRYITCHSYVQSEILMLMRLAERLGFRVRTFTHVLEGYKVAPEMKQHGAFASTFSDWWAYKYEVIEAIPHNAAMLLSKGVPTCINSDDAEMGRRLNQEAAKILRYGGSELGVDSLTAWRTVTVYPAQALGISHRTGYVKPGYDADIVLWDRPSPLSVYSQVRMTFVEGRKLYDREENVRLHAEAIAEKNRLLEKAWKAAQEETKGPPLLLRRAVLWDCESFGGEEGREEP
ncbi:MAG: amidohydrolase family protein [Bacteroidia bacterium]|nr:amidohydrolase family protein [Bacteroidia bacterium]